jgi:hypothetical protein
MDIAEEIDDSGGTSVGIFELDDSRTEVFVLLEVFLLKEKVIHLFGGYQFLELVLLLHFPNNYILNWTTLTSLPFRLNSLYLTIYMLPDAPPPSDASSILLRGLHWLAIHSRNTYFPTYPVSTASFPASTPNSPPTRMLFWSSHISPKTPKLPGITVCSG